MQDVNATRIFYDYLVVIERHFNSALFDGALQTPLLTLKRGLGSLGHFAPMRWERGSDAVGEIALNPALFGQETWLSLMQTIVHQQCHLWQYQFGSPSRPGYHNAEWAGQMQKIGLMPSATGEPGGRKTGQHVLEYPVNDGPFLLACAHLADNGLAIPLAGRFGLNEEAAASPPDLSLNLPADVLARLCSCVGTATDEADVAEREEVRTAKRKVKYSCPKCRASVWGRSGLALKCQQCKRLLKVADGTGLTSSNGVREVILAAVPRPHRPRAFP